MRLGTPAAALAVAVMAGAIVAAPAAAATVLPTTVEAHVERTGRAGAPRGLVAHLFDATDEPVAGQRVDLYERQSGTTAWTLADDAPTDAHGAAQFTVAPSTAMQYTVRHAGSATTAPASGPVLEPGVIASSTPRAPFRMLADPADGAVHLEWVPALDEGPAAVAAYDLVVRRTDGAGTPVTVPAPPDAREALVGGLPNGVGHTVSIVTRDVQGRTSGAMSTTVTPRADAPAWPVPPAGGSRVCGRLPYGTTSWDATGSPYHVCRLGVLVGIGSTLEVTGAEVRFTSSPATGNQGIEVNGGGLRVTDSTLHGAEGRPGEWTGIRLGAPFHNHVSRTSGTLSLTRTEVRDAIDAVRSGERASYLRLDDSLLADASGAGLAVADMPMRLAGLTIRDVGGPGAELTCGSGTTRCPVHVDGLTVERAAGRGLLLDTYGPATVKGVVVTASGTAAPVSEAARITRLAGSYGAGADVEDVHGGGNGVDAVLLDMRHSADLTWRTPVAGSAAAPAPLGFVAGGLRMAEGRSVTFPPGSVVKVAERPYAPGPCLGTVAAPCWGGIAVTDGTLTATDTTFTSAADASTGISTCPSAFVPACGTASWAGLSLTGSTGVARLTGGTVRGARTGLSVRGRTGSAGVVAAVTGTTFRAGTDGVLASGTGSLELTGVTVDRPASRGIEVYGLTTVHLTGVAVRGAGVRLDGNGGAYGCARTTDVRVDGLLAEEAPGVAVRLEHMCRPYVRAVTVRRSGAPGAGDDLGHPAVELGGTYTLGPAGDVDGLTGGGNGVDAVALGGHVTGDVAWLSPYNAAADHPLGYAIGRSHDEYTQIVEAEEGLTTHGGTVRVPANGLVASLGVMSYGNANGKLHLRGTALDATAGGARFVNARDPLAALGCVRRCGTAPWGGVHADGPVEHERASDVRLDGATVRGAHVVTDHSVGTFAMTRSDSDSLVLVEAPDVVTVTDSRLRALNVSRAGRADVSRNTFAGDLSYAVLLTGRGQHAPSAITLRDNVTVGEGAGWAYQLRVAHVRLGPGGSVDGNLATGESAALALGSVTTAADVTWVSPTNEAFPHPVGYVVTNDLGHDDPAFTVDGPRTLTLPAGAVVQTGGTIRLRGARLDATAGGARITSMYGEGGLCPGDRTCGGTSVLAWNGTPRTVVDAVPDPATGKAGGIALRGARVSGAIRVDGPAGLAPGSARNGLVLDSSLVLGGVQVWSAPASITRSRLRLGESVLSGSDGFLVRDTTFEDTDASGLSVHGGTGVVTESEFHDTARVYDGWDPTAALEVGSATTTLSCLDVSGNGSGLRTTAQSRVAISDSALTGNARDYDASDHDLDNHVATTTTRVWWGQAGGPRPGQVRDPALHTGVSPAAAKPACAVAETAVPPDVPRAVAATAVDNAVTATWQPPADDGGAPVTEYRVTVSPIGTTRVVPAGTGSVTIPVAPGTGYAVSVAAVNAAGAGTPSQYSAPVTPGGDGAPPVASALTASAPALVTYGTDAVVTGTLATAAGPLAGRLVAVRTRPAGSSAWATAATVVTSASGTVSRALRLPATSEVVLSYAGDATSLPSSSPVRTVAVRPVVTSAWSRSSVVAGTTVTFSGRVSPALAGMPLRIERYTRYGWQRVTTTYLTRTSAYVLKVTPRTRGTYRYRAVYDATSRHARAVSPTRTLTVT